MGKRKSFQPSPKKPSEKQKTAYPPNLKTNKLFFESRNSLFEDISKNNENSISTSSVLNAYFG